MSTNESAERETHPAPEQKTVFIFFVDDRQFEVRTPTITVSGIKELAGIPREIELIEILQDGTQRVVPDSEVAELDPGRHFKKLPRFKRG